MRGRRGRRAGPSRRRSSPRASRGGRWRTHVGSPSRRPPCVRSGARGASATTASTLGELAHPQAAVGRLGEADEDLVVGHGDAVVALHVPVEGLGQQDVRGDPAAPRPLLVRGQPANGVLRRRHGPMVVEIRTTHEHIDQSPRPCERASSSAASSSPRWATLGAVRRDGGEAVAHQLGVDQPRGIGEPDVGEGPAVLVRAGRRSYSSRTGVRRGSSRLSSAEASRAVALDGGVGLDALRGVHADEPDALASHDDRVAVDDAVDADPVTGRQRRRPSRTGEAPSRRAAPSRSTTTCRR